MKDFFLWTVFFLFLEKKIFEHNNDISVIISIYFCNVLLISAKHGEIVLFCNGVDF